MPKANRAPRSALPLPQPLPLPQHTRTRTRGGNLSPKWHAQHMPRACVCVSVCNVSCCVVSCCDASCCRQTWCDTCKWVEPAAAKRRRVGEGRGGKAGHRGTKQMGKWPRSHRGLKCCRHWVNHSVSQSICVGTNERTQRTPLRIYTEYISNYSEFTTNSIANRNWAMQGLEGTQNCSPKSR